MDNRTPLFLGLVVLYLASVSHFSVCRAQAAARPRQPKSLSFYFYLAVQNTTSPINNTFTAILSAQPVQPQPLSFGNIHSFDTPITSNQSLSSEHLGKVQGWYGDIGQQTQALFLCQTFVIDTQDLKGTFSLLGIYGGTGLLQAQPIVGGTGDFAFARGIANQTVLSSESINDQTIAWFLYTVEFAY